MVASPLLVRLMAPGFDAADRVLAIGLTRALFPFLLLVSVGALAMGVLNSLDSFFVPAVAPAASNLVFIFFLLCFLHHPSLTALVTAVLLGGAAHLLLQWAWCARMGMLLVPLRPDRSDPDLRRMFALFLPYAAGLSLNQLNPVISRMLGSFLEGGSISVLNYADRVLQLPLGLFVIAISQAVLPLLSRLAPEDREGFAEFIRDALRFNLFVVVPVSLGLFLFSPEVVHLLFVRGRFGDWAWHATAAALALYGLGLPGMSSVTVTMRALYARNLPRGAVTVTAFTVAANLAMSLVLMRLFSYAGLAAATSLAFTGAALVGVRVLRRDLGRSLRIFDRAWTGRLLCACGVLGAGLLSYRWLLPYPIGGGILPRAAWLGGAALLGGGTYGAATLLMRCPEWSWLRGAMKRSPVVAVEESRE
jgi:putative peptidoglycan lipid II flippase